MTKTMISLDQSAVRGAQKILWTLLYKIFEQFRKISHVLVLKWLDCSKMAGNSRSELEFSTMLPKKRK